ncbi:MAG TPA: hypothetical protein GXX46_09795 [Peptococcaceae bacterium]|nr:hypothetical protein [Peptococcaceae bacterium]
MAKKLMAILLVCLLGAFLISGCGGNQPAAPAPQAPDAEKGQEAGDSEPVDSKPAGGETAAPTMDEAGVLELVQEAIKHKYYVQAGGNIEGKLETFEHEEMEYRYLGPDLETKDKLLAYLEETFTPETAEQFITEMMFIEKDGRMAQPNADGGSILQWDKAEVSLIQEAGNSKEFAFKVPYGDEANLQYETIPMQVTYVDGKGWRVATSPSVL